jgi:hypothetical protein
MQIFFNDGSALSVIGENGLSRSNRASAGPLFG